jgi:TRAP-type uncharacterized transport system substrate-binding protein
LYRWVDPLPPRRLAIAAGIPGTAYDAAARQYQGILARSGVSLEVRNYAGGIEHFEVLRDPSSGVQAAITTFGFTDARDSETLYSLGGISDSPIFIFYRSEEALTSFGQFAGKRAALGAPTTVLRAFMIDALRAARVEGVQFVDLEYAPALDALDAGAIDIAAISAQSGNPLLMRALRDPKFKLMNIAQAEGVAKVIPGLQRVVLSKGVISLGEDLPRDEVNLLALRNRLLVRRDLHPALQYLLLEAMREVHWPSGPLNAAGAYPAPQENDLPLSPTAEAFYHSGRSGLERYTAFWLSSLLNRAFFFIIPIALLLVPVVSVAPRVVGWVGRRQLNRLHAALTDLEADLRAARDVPEARLRERFAAIDADVRFIRVSKRFSADLHRLRIHLRMVKEDLDRHTVVADALRA